MKKLNLSVLVLGSTLLTISGCKNIAGVGGTVTNTNGDLGGSVQITFRDATGKVVTRTVPRSKELNTILGQ